MNWATRRLLIPALCLFSAIAAHASDTAPAPVTDPVLVGDHYRQVLQRPEFQAPADIDADARFKDWLSQWFLHLGSRLSEFQYSQELHSFSLFLIAVLLMLTLAGLLYIVVRFSRRRGFREEVEPTGTPGQKKFRPPEFYDEEIRKAVADGDWHDAWLVTWRQFLSRLENRRLVEADRTRTNREYLAQLREQSIPPSIFTLIARMVDAYDRFIYGCSPIGKTEWDLFHQQVDEATLLLHLDAKMTRPGEKTGGGMNRNSVYIRVLLVIVAIVVLLAFANRSPHRTLHDTWLPSSFNPVDGGNMALYQTLKELNWPVERWREPLSRLSDDGTGNTLIVTRSRVGRRVDFSEQEAALLDQWVRNGNTLLLVGALDEWTDTRQLLRQFGFALPEKTGPKSISELLDPFEPQTNEQMEIHPTEGAAQTGTMILPLTPPLLFTFPKGTRVLWQQEGRPYVIDVPLGAGRVVCAASSQLLDNNYLGKGDNLAIVLHLLAPGGRAPRHLIFEESHHGYSAVYAMTRLLDHPGVRFAGMLVLLGALAFLGSSLIRFGPTLPLRREQGRSTLEFVDSIADLYQRADLRNDMMRYLFAETHRRVLQRLNLPPTASHDLIASRLQQANPHLPKWKKLAQRFDSRDYVDGLPPTGWLRVARELIEIKSAMA